MSNRGESFDLTCLKALRVEADPGRLALCAATIVVHAYAAARAAPDARGHALRIVELARQLHAGVPTQASLSALLEEGLAEIDAGGPSRRAAVRERLVGRILDHLRGGVRRP